MNELITQTTQLPDNLEDLTQFVLVGKAKLQAYMLKLQTVNKLSVAQEIRDQTLKEAQEVSTAVIAAEQRIGELLLQIPKAQGFASTIRDNGEPNVKTKTETVKEMGYSEREAKDYQTMAKNPQVVQKVIDDAIQNGEVVNKSQVMKEIKALRDEVNSQKAANEALRADNKILANRVKPEVVEKEVIKEVVPDDYEEAKKSAEKWERSYKESVSDYRKIADENLELKKRIRELQEPTTEQKIVSNAKEEMEYFIVATYEYIRKYGGKVWAFDKYKDAPVDTQKNFQKAIQQLSAFSQQLVNNLGGIEA